MISINTWHLTIWQMFSQTLKLTVGKGVWKKNKKTGVQNLRPNIFSTYSCHPMLQINTLHCLHRVYQLLFTKLSHLLSSLNVIVLPLVLFILPGIVCLFSRQPGRLFGGDVGRDLALKPSYSGFLSDSCCYFCQIKGQCDWKQLFSQHFDAVYPMVIGAAVLSQISF